MSGSFHCKIILQNLYFYKQEFRFNLCTLRAHFQYSIGELDTLFSVINSCYKVFTIYKTVRVGIFSIVDCFGLACKLSAFVD